MRLKKNILFIIAFTSVIALQSNAQTYEANKLKYDFHNYVHQYDDPYDPAISGVCSFLMPGLGQLLDGETNRGLEFLGGYLGCGAICFSSFGPMISSALNGSRRPSPTGAILFFAGAFGMAGVSIWSIVDAVHVAQTNNMYYQDVRKTSSLNLEVAPYFSQISINNQQITPVGISLRLKF